MLATKHPLVFLALILGVVLAVVVAIVETGNPLAILALFFLPQLASVPVMPPSEVMLRGNEEDDDDSVPMGFTADVR